MTIPKIKKSNILNFFFPGFLLARGELQASGRHVGAHPGSTGESPARSRTSEDGTEAGNTFITFILFHILLFDNILSLLFCFY